MVALLCGWLVLATAHGCAACGILSYPLIAYIGRFSYGLYLWHYVLILSRNDVGISGEPSLALAVIISFLLAIVSFELLATPISRYALRSIKR